MNQCSEVGPVYLQQLPNSGDDAGPCVFNNALSQQHEEMAGQSIETAHVVSSLRADDAISAEWVSASKLRRQRRQKAQVKTMFEKGGGYDNAWPKWWSAAIVSPIHSPISPEHGLPVEHREELEAMIKAGGQDLQQALQFLRGSVWRLSQDANACWVVQLALETIGRPDAASLVTELHGHVFHAMKCPHANYVIQKAVEKMVPVDCAFIASELLGQAMFTACHRFGCRIFCRLIEHCAANVETASLIGELLSQVGDLSRDRFGHYVAMSILEHGSTAQKHEMVRALQDDGDLLRLARHRNGRHVVELALIHCSLEDRRCLANELLKRPRSVTVLSQSKYARSIMKALGKLGEEYAQLITQHLQADVHHLQQTKFGGSMLSHFGVGYRDMI